MIIAFEDFEIVPEREELRRDGEPVHVERRVFSLLSHLVANHERLVTKDELIEKVWDGRFISDSALSTAIKDARKAVGDDGQSQNFIKTVHGRGFRFVAQVSFRAPASAATGGAPTEIIPVTAPEAPSLSGKPAMAVLPFQMLGGREGDPLGDALPAEIISALSRLRWLSVTARGSSFRFRTEQPDLAAIRDILGVGYLLTGIVEDLGADYSVTTELVDTASGTLVWSEVYRLPKGDILEIRPQIVSSVITALELHLPLHEADAASLKSPDKLDAWGLYHLGLRHLYRFNRKDNDIARAHFEKAVKLDPRFARAHAGLSFSAFQTAFMHYDDDHDVNVRLALQAAERGLEADYLDPFANYCMGRVSWLNGDLEGGQGWLSRSVEISPSFAQGHYARSMMQALSGLTTNPRAGTATAMKLSPLDPLHYAMLSCHGVSYVNESRFDEAAVWAERGARAPGAHYNCGLMAAAVHQMAGNSERALYWAADARARHQGANAETFFSSFPFADGEGRKNFADAFKVLGL